MPWIANNSHAEGRGGDGDERAAIVTGASSGIGLAIAAVLCEEGFGVTVVARGPQGLSAALEPLLALGYDVHSVAADMSQERDIERMVADHAERFGRLDLLVNNAGVGIGSPLAEMQTKHIDLQLQLNVGSMVFAYECCESMLRDAARQRGTASVVNVSSIFGVEGVAWLSGYSAAKHAIVGWTEAMNRERSRTGIKFTALCPGWVDTPMASFMKEQLEPGAMLAPADVAEAVRFLLRLSPSATVSKIVLGAETQAKPPRPSGSPAGVLER